MLGAGIAFITIGILLVVFAATFFVGLFGMTPQESALVGTILSLQTS